MTMSLMTAGGTRSAAGSGLYREAEELIENVDRWWTTPNDMLAGRTPEKCADEDPEALRQLFGSIKYIGFT